MKRKQENRKKEDEIEGNKIKWEERKERELETRGEGGGCYWKNSNKNLRFIRIHKNNK